MQLFANNATSVLANSISAAATSLQLAPGSGTRFPNPANGNYFLLTLYQIAGNTEINHEIVKCTARNGDTLTIQRAQEGTAARAFHSADPVSLRLTAGTFSPAAFGLEQVNNTPDNLKPVSAAQAAALALKAPLTGEGASGTWPINTSGTVQFNHAGNADINYLISFGTGFVQSKLLADGELRYNPASNTLAVPNIAVDAITINSLRRTAGAIPFSLVAQDGTGRLHLYWNSFGGITPRFESAGEDAMDLMMTTDNTGIGGSLLFRTANGVGKMAGDGLTWTNLFYVDGSRILFKDHTIYHSGNLPIASAATLGAVKAGANLSVDANGILNAPAPGAMQLLASFKLSNPVANLDALNIFNAGFDSYLIVGTGLVPSANDSLCLRWANAGVLDVSSMNYYKVREGTLQTMPTDNIGIGYQALTASKGMGFSMHLHGANDASRLKIINTDSVSQANPTPGFLMTKDIFTYVGAAVSGFRLYWAGGSNFTAGGTVQIYGYKNT